MSEKVEHVVERRLQRVGRIYPLKLRVGKSGGKGKVKD